MENNRVHPVVSWWLGSLAISVTCCAILFIFFAGYVDDLKETVSSQRARMDILEQSNTEMVRSLMSLRKRIPSNQTVSAAPAEIPPAPTPAVATDAPPSAAAPAIPAPPTNIEPPTLPNPANPADVKTP